MDLDPVPGLPLLTTLFCETSTVKKKTTVKCEFPDALYTKKSFYGGLVGAGLGVVEIALIAVFVLLCFKMKHDVTKVFLSIVYIPLGLSSIFKIALAVYSIMEGAYGWFYMVFLMFFNWLYTIAVLNTSIGSVIYLAALIVVARKKHNFNPFDSWISYFSVLFFSALLSGSYHFVSYQWNQLPAASIFFTYVLCTVGIVAELLVSLCIVFICNGEKKSSDVVILTGDPVVDDARSRLAWGALSVIVMNIPQWFEIYVKITELFTPYLWDSDKQKTVFYTAQAKELLTLDTIRIFLSLLMLVAMFITVSGRFAIQLWLHKKPHPNSTKKHEKSGNAAQNKVFVASQTQPLLMETGEKKKEVHHHASHHHEPEKRPIPPTPPTATTTHTNPSHVHAPPAQTSQMIPPQYPGVGFSPGMLQLPHNMQTTIVYTPAVAYENINGHMQVEKFK
uniref:Uncharacterized protein n=1 Tax=Caenorhabditis japonica TaxID=281687 RepID=A0A8R1HVM6_CAEJA